MPLKDTLRSMLCRALASKEPARVRLLHGLAIAIRADSADVVSLQLSRADVFPSTNEWKTVIQAWPGQCVMIATPTTSKIKGTYYLRGKIRLVKELMQ